MQAVIATADRRLKFVDLPIPECRSQEVLIQVKAAGINRADLSQRQGKYPPPAGAPDTLGLECAGIVAAVGEDVTRWRVGERVCALLAGGGYAEFAAVDEGSVLPLPDQISFEHAACFPEAVWTVWANVFMRAAFQPGESVLIHGGTSGIGVMGIQMARHCGASRIFTTAGTDQKTALALELGADLAINYRTEDFVDRVQAAGVVDVVLDMVGGDYVQKNISIANLNGRICNIAYQQGFQTEVDFQPVLMKRLTLTATTLRSRSAAEKREIRNAIEEHIWPAVIHGRIRPILDSTFPLAQAEQAHLYMSQGEHSGKIVLVV